MKKILIIVSIIVLAAAGYYFLYARPEPPVTKEVGGQMFTFGSPKKSAHYESNTPSHAAVLPAVPLNVVIDFNFDLVANSEISVTKDGKDYGVGPTIIDENLLALRRALDPAAPDGVYTVNYKACWPDRSCHTGHFQFAIDRSARGSYQDLRNRPEVTVRMKDIRFSAMDIIISKGTKVVWVNDDSVAHYVNTDAHPSHTYHLAQNSKLLNKGDTFAYKFDTSGAYPYHCSAHASVMKGSIIVE